MQYVDELIPIQKALSKLVVECELRSLNPQTDKLIGEINFSEFLNDSFIILEQVRQTLKDLHGVLYEEPYSTHSHFVEGTIDGLTRYSDILRSFQNKWAVSYNAWYSSFKSHRANHSIVACGDPQNFLSIQAAFHNCRELQKDITAIVCITQTLIEAYNDYSRAITLAKSRHRMYASKPRWWRKTKRVELVSPTPITLNVWLTTAQRTPFFDISE